jgi:lipopolysaccharide export system permease protein
VPTRLTRYVVLEILKIFVVSLIALTLLFLLIGVGRDLMRRGLGPVAVLQLLPFVLPISLKFAFPATALFSVCCVYGRMASDGEVATVKASGVSPLKLLQPALVFAALLSPFAVFVSDLAVSWGRPGVNRVVLMSIEDIAYRVLKSDHSYTSDHGFSIHVRDVVVEP